MKIVITSTGASKEANADMRFGRCSHFAVYNTETSEYSFIENTAVSSNQGAGIAAAQTVVDQKAEVVLTGNLGPKAMHVLVASQITGYRIEEMSIEKAVEAFQGNRLSQITEPGKAHFGMKK